MKKPYDHARRSYKASDTGLLLALFSENDNEILQNFRYLPRLHVLDQNRATSASIARFCLTRVDIKGKLGHCCCLPQSFRLDPSVSEWP